MTSLQVTLKDSFMGRYFLNVDGLFVGSMDLHSQTHDVITKMHREAKCEPWAEDQRSFELKREGASAFFFKARKERDFHSTSGGEMFVKKDEGKTQVCEVFLLLTC